MDNNCDGHPVLYPHICPSESSVHPTKKVNLMRQRIVRDVLWDLQRLEIVTEPVPRICTVNAPMFLPHHDIIYIHGYS